MFRIASLPMPIFSTVFALIIGVLGLMGHRYLERATIQVNELEAHYHQAIVQSGAFLASHLHELKHYVNMNNLDKGGKDRVFRSYGSLFLRHGELDQLEVYSIPACKLILKASLDKSIQTSCFDKPKPSGQFFWDQTTKGYPVMGLRVSLPENPNILLAAKLVLDKEWITLFPSIAKQVAAMKLNLNQNSDLERYLLAEAGYKPQSGYMASLWSEHWLLSLLPSRISILKMAFAQIQIVFLLLSALLALLSMAVLKGRIRATEKRKREFYTWCKDLLQNTIHPAHKQEQITKSLYGDDNYRLWCESLLSLKKEEQSKKSDFLCHFKEVNHENQKLKEKVKRLKEELSLVAENESLSYHICQNAPLLIEKQLHQKRQLKTIHDFNQKELFHALNQFNQLFTNWSDSLQEKGSRKFLRSLCEVTGTQGGKHKLEENIEEFIDLGNQLLTTSEKTHQIINQLYLEKDLSLKTLSYWSGLAFVEEGTNTFPMQIEEVCSYVSKLLKFEKGSWDGKISIPENLKTLKFTWIPNSVLIASFYHIISLITSFTKVTNLDIVFHGKFKGDLSHLFVTLASGVLNDSTSIFTPSPIHWKKVKHLLLPYGIDLSYLPGRKDQATLSLSWLQESSRKEAKVTKNDADQSQLG
ncbi:MAG: hypothetical protein HRU09_08240 [Oligoflexales bacterium]|nr:hypothetical protein [Oligoflexales bacterium]